MLVVGGLLLAARGGLDGVTPPRVLAAALLVVGAGLLVGTWYGRARWLLLPGVLLVLALGATTAVQGPYGWEVGERTWVPADGTGDARYRLGAGEATLDLRGLQPGELDRVRAQVGAGHLVVLVPDGLPVRLSTDVQAGEVVQDGAGRRTTPAAGTPHRARPVRPRRPDRGAPCRRHDRDAVSLMGGLLLVLVALGALLDSLTDLRLDAGWAGPLALVAVGLVGLAASVRRTGT